MNEETKDALNQFLKDMIEGLESGAKFAGEQIPILLHEILYWGFAKSFIFFSAGVVLFIFGICFLKKAWRNIPNLKNEIQQKLDEEFKKSGKSLRDFCIGRRNGDISNSAWRSYYSPFGDYRVEPVADGFGIFAAYLIPCFCIVVSLPLVFTNLTWLQVAVAPRLYLLEYASNLIK